MRHRELLTKVKALDKHPEPQEIPADVADRAVESSNEEMALRVVEIRVGEINSIEEALQKITDGTYGKCEWCGKQIPAARLKLLPNATHCVACQQELERDMRGSEDGLVPWERLAGSAGEESPAVRTCGGSKF